MNENGLGNDDALGFFHALRDVLVHGFAVFVAAAIAEQAEQSYGNIPGLASRVRVVWRRGHPSPGAGRVAVVRQRHFNGIRAVAVRIHHSADTLRALGIDDFVGVHMKQPVAGGGTKHFVARFGEVVVPLDENHACVETPGNGDGLVR